MPKRALGPKRRRRPGPASRALKAFYQQQRQEAAVRKKRLARQSVTTFESDASYEHKYDEEDDGRTETSSSCGEIFESKSQDYEDLVTPRVDSRRVLQVSFPGTSTAPNSTDSSSSSSSVSSSLGSGHALRIHLTASSCEAPKKRQPKGPSEEIDFYADVPDTSRIDLTSM